MAKAEAGEQVTLASTTSTENSGLLAYLLPPFTRESGIRVRVISVGTGQALRLGRNGDADLLLTHAPEREARFVAEGWGLRRLGLMYNDFILVGPSADPARLATAPTAVAALRRIAGSGAAFASRGDESGTHMRERALWRKAGLAPAPGQAWYRELGAGMGAVLNAAAAMDAYALTDRATWLAFGNRRNLKRLFQGDPALFNQYALIVVNPARHPHVRYAAALRLSEWLRGPKGQELIAAFRLQGRQVFFPNAGAAR